MASVTETLDNNIDDGRDWLLAARYPFPELAVRDNEERTLAAAELGRGTILVVGNRAARQREDFSFARNYFIDVNRPNQVRNQGRMPFHASALSPFPASLLRCADLIGDDFARGDLPASPSASIVNLKPFAFSGYSAQCLASPAY